MIHALGFFFGVIASLVVLAFIVFISAIILIKIVTKLYLNG